MPFHAPVVHLDVCFGEVFFKTLADGDGDDYKEGDSDDGDSDDDGDDNDDSDDGGDNDGDADDFAIEL